MNALWKKKALDQVSFKTSPSLCEPSQFALLSPSLNEDDLTVSIFPFWGIEYTWMQVFL